MLFQNPRRPDAELSAAPGIDSITNGKNGVKVKVFHLVSFTI
jgi:hypothetical protein